MFNCFIEIINDDDDNELNLEEEQNNDTVIKKLNNDDEQIDNDYNMAKRKANFKEMKIFD